MNTILKPGQLWAPKLCWRGGRPPRRHSRTERNSPSASFILSPVEGLRTSFPVTPLFSTRAVVISTVCRESHRDSGREEVPGSCTGYSFGCHPFDRPLVLWPRDKGLRAGSSDVLPSRSLP